VANEFYHPGDQRADRVRELFTRVARKYDLVNDLQSFGMHRYWKRRLIRLAGVQPGDRALDICCGTGDLALLLAERGARVFGADFTENMLSVATERVQAWKPPQTTTATPASSTLRVAPVFVRGDALALPFADATFDLITMAYGLRNLADVKAGLREIRRVAKPGARILILEFGKPDNQAWRAIYFAYLKIFVPVLGLMVCGSASAYAYILESLKNYPAQHAIAAHMRELNLTKVKIVSFWAGVMTINYAEKPPV
jgi:demethylmenaquinone methyltransferase/2-methoxy-6-polyprenyl-1,4-benzoquinol methylase